MTGPERTDGMPPPVCEQQKSELVSKFIATVKQSVSLACWHGDADTSKRIAAIARVAKIVFFFMDAATAGGPAETVWFG